MDMLVVAMETLGKVALERSLQSLQVTLLFRSDGMIWIEVSVSVPLLFLPCSPHPFPQVPRRHSIFRGRIHLHTVEFYSVLPEYSK